MILPYTRENALIVGKLLIRKQPTLAAELLSSYHPEQPHDTDLDHIEHYLQRFCRINNIPVDDIVCSRNTDLKRLFICCMVAIYCPDHLRAGGSRMHGLLAAIAEHFNVTRQSIGLLAQQIVVQYKVYDEFREKVDEITDKMKRFEF